MATKSLDQVRAEMERLHKEEVRLTEARRHEVGAIAERAGALELPNDVLFGALLAASEDGDAAARFRERGSVRRNRGRRARAPVSRAAASGAPPNDASANSTAGA